MESFRKENLRKRTNESDDQRAHRVAHIVQHVWERSSLSLEHLGAEPLGSDEPATVDNLFNRSLRWKRVPPPPAETVLGWVKDAYKESRATGRPVRSQLIWKMLGHRYGLTTNQIRHRIDTARKARKWWKEQNE